MTDSKQITITYGQNNTVRELIDGRVATTKNWLVSAIERGDHIEAAKLVYQIRELEKLMHTFVPKDMWDR